MFVVVAFGSFTLATGAAAPPTDRVPTADPSPYLAKPVRIVTLLPHRPTVEAVAGWRRAALAAKPQYVTDVLADGAQRAGAIAKETLSEVKQRMGLV